MDQHSGQQIAIVEAFHADVAFLFKRCQVVIVTRLRIGHRRQTVDNLLRGEPAPARNNCPRYSPLYRLNGALPEMLRGGRLTFITYWLFKLQ